MKRLTVSCVALACATILTGCGDKSAGASERTASEATSKEALKPRKKALPRKKVSVNDATKILLAQMREWMELVGLSQSYINRKMFDIETDLEKVPKESRPLALYKLLKAENLNPCLSEEMETMHLKTSHEKVLMEYAKDRQVDGKWRARMVFEFRSLPEDEQEESAGKLAKLMN